MEPCQICGKPPSPYPNWIIGEDLAAHVGCLADAFPGFLAALETLLDRMTDGRSEMSRGELAENSDLIRAALAKAKA